MGWFLSNVNTMGTFHMCWPVIFRATKFWFCTSLSLVVQLPTTFDTLASVDRAGRGGGGADDSGTQQACQGLCRSGRGESDHWWAVQLTPGRRQPRQQRSLWRLSAGLGHGSVWAIHLVVTQCYDTTRRLHRSKFSLSNFFQGLRELIKATYLPILADVLLNKATCIGRRAHQDQDASAEEEGT